MSVLDILAIVHVTSSLSTSDRWAGCKWCEKDQGNWLVKVCGYGYFQ